MGPQTPRIDSMEPDVTRIKHGKHYPLELCYVKALFCEGQYRQCITTCWQILDTDDDDQTRHPLMETFLRLYVALAHDDLARAMHDFSSTKLPAFDQAESLYRQAAAAIPGVEQYSALLAARDPTPEETHESGSAPLPQSISQSTLNSDVFRRPPSPSPFLSPPTHARASDLPTINSPGDSDSETDEELQSHDDFDQVTPPLRIPRLPSTFSSMSLLDPQKQARGLLRPVRPGSIAKPYQAPQSSSPSPRHHHSRLPRLYTGRSLGSPQRTPLRQSSPVRKQLRSPDEDWDAPPSPVSPLGSAYVPNDDGAISPISPSRPSTPTEANTAYGPDRSLAHELPKSTEGSESEFAKHAEGLRMQIDTQMDLLQEARGRTVAAQEERAVKNNLRKLPATKASTLGGGMQQSRSFWLFTPDDHKVMDKQRRIQAGRQRTWARARFDPSRYQALAERALAEL